MTNLFSRAAEARDYSEHPLYWLPPDPAKGRIIPGDGQVAFVVRVVVFPLARAGKNQHAAWAA